MTEPKQDDEIAKRLAEVRAKRSELANKAAAREAARSAADQLEQEELALKNAQAIEDAETTHGTVGKKIAVIDTDLGVIIVKRTNPVLFKRFQDKASIKTDDCDKLARPCLVYPDASTFDRIIEELPATLTRVANAIAALAGTRVEDVTGKS